MRKHHEPLTYTQGRAYKAIVDYYQRHYCYPPLWKLCELMGYRNLNASVDMVKALMRKGYLTRSRRNRQGYIVEGIITLHEELLLDMIEAYDSNDDEMLLLTRNRYARAKDALGPSTGRDGADAKRRLFRASLDNIPTKPESEASLLSH